ncbi:MAG TPA: zinc-binding dehydrogenase [Burkholderiales bacterium]|nr:zinc-binding dehydrogenase [Burkholderiales bacterium]
MSLPPTQRAGLMRAACLVAPGRIEIGSMPLPQPGARQVRIRVAGCGVCGSNLAVWQGRPWFNYPLESGAPGHEGWGEIEALGEGVERFSIGDRVGFLSQRSFAEYALADSDTLVVAPPRSDMFPAEALGCAVNVFRRAQIHAGQSVAVVGCGFIGALVIQLATRAGARVFALSRRDFARAIARRCGACEVLSTDDAALERILDLTAGAGCERVIEAAGAQESLDLAGRLVKIRGRLVIAGYHQDGSRRVDMQAWNWRGIDVINAHERDPNAYVSGMSAAAEFIARGTLDCDFLYTHKFSIDQLPAALDALAARPESFLKGWIAF